MSTHFPLLLQFLLQIYFFLAISFACHLPASSLSSSSPSPYSYSRHTNCEQGPALTVPLAPGQVRTYVELTRPPPSDDSHNPQSWPYKLDIGGLDYALLTADPSNWMGTRQIDSEKSQIHDLTYSRHRDHPNALSIRLSMLIYHYLDDCVNSGDKALPHLPVRVIALDDFFAYTQAHVNGHLKSMPESTFHIRCVVPHYDRRTLNGKEVSALAELIMVEYFRSPWQMEWKRRVTNAPVAVEWDFPLYKFSAGEAMASTADRVFVNLRPPKQP